MKREYVIYGILCCLFFTGIGMRIGLSANRKTYKKINPTIRIETINGKSDTTYIYKF